MILCVYIRKRNGASRQCQDSYWWNVVVYKDRVARAIIIPQQDSQELIRFVVDTIHEELKATHPSRTE